jgi:hypothetical protein
MIGRNMFPLPRLAAMAADHEVSRDPAHPSAIILPGL